MEADLSNIQPYQRLRDMMGYYTNELSRSMVDLAKQRAQRKWLRSQMDERAAFLTTRTTFREKWRATAQAKNDKKFQKLSAAYDVCDSTIDLLEALLAGFKANYDALSREMTARHDEKKRYDGRGGGATA